MTPTARVALDAISADDAKPSVCALSDLSQGPTSAVARALDMLAAELAASSKVLASGATARSATPSTIEPSDESDVASGATTPRKRRPSKFAHKHDRRQSSSARWTAKEEGGSTDWDIGNAEDLAWWAIEEINQQLGTPGNNGYVWITSWNQTYGRQLGSLRTFLESRPDQFTVKPGKGKGFRVASASVASFRERSCFPKAVGR